MSKISLNYIVLSPQELNAINNIIIMSCEAFKQRGYPLYYDCFLMNIYNVIQLGAAAVTSAYPLSRYHEFGNELDKLASFMRAIRTVDYYKLIALKEKEKSKDDSATSV
jgi:hypothetical protein